MQIRRQMTIESNRGAAMGLIAAIVGVTFVASAAGQGFKWGKVTLLALALTAGSYLIFILLLRLVLPIWPEWD